MVDVAAYIAAGAPIPDVDPVAAAPAVVLPGKTKENRRRRWGRKGRFLRGAGAYLDIGQYYNSAETTEAMRRCCNTWLYERKGTEERYRGIGCGQREWCPTCSVFHRDKLAGDGAADVLMAIEGMEVGQLLDIRDCGTKVVLSIPKETSAWIDSFDDRRWGKVDALRRAAYKFFGLQWPGSFGVTGIDFCGESNPGEPHFHINAHLLPGGGKLKDGRWTWWALNTFIPPEKLADARKLWRDCVAEALGLDAPGLDVPELVFWSNPLVREAQLRHWLRYLYRSPIYDLWKGWEGIDGDGCVDYSVWKFGSSVVQKIASADIHKSLERVASTPRKWKRIRWFGAFSDGQRTGAMASLGLKRVEKIDAAEEGWTQVGLPFRFKRFRRREEGSGVVLIAADGAHVVIGDGLANYGPSGVKLARRTRYVRPGT